MAIRKEIESLRELGDDVLLEVIREGEARVEAQFSAASASDQRAMTWTGFLVTALAASSGMFLSLINEKEKQTALLMIIAAFELLLFFSLFRAIQAVKPGHFHLPGNEPKLWSPSEWYGHDQGDYSLKQARIEQANALQAQIEENKKWATASNESLRSSIEIAFMSLLVCTVAASLALLYKDMIPQGFNPFHRFFNHFLLC